MANEVIFGKTTGSLVNGLQAMATRGQPVPEVGMGVTFLGWTGRHPGTIREIFVQGVYQYIRCTADEYKRIDNNGFSEHQEYEYTITEDKGQGQFFRRKIREGGNAPFIGCYKNPETGRFVKGSQRIRIGHRDKYHDFSF